MTIRLTVPERYAESGHGPPPAPPPLRPGRIGAPHILDAGPIAPPFPRAAHLTLPDQDSGVRRSQKIFRNGGCGSSAPFRTDQSMAKGGSLCTGVVIGYPVSQDAILLLTARGNTQG